MAPVESAPNAHANSRAIAGWPNALAALFLLAIFVSLRILDDTARTAGLVVAWLAWAGMLAGRIRGRLSADADGKRLLLVVGGPADALLLVGGALSEWFVFGDKVPDPVLAGGVLALVAGGALTLALELVTGPMRATGFVDNRRVLAAARTAATLVAAVAGLFALNYGAAKLDIRRDFSFAAPTAPSAATLSMLDAASCTDADGKPGKPEIFLFFERGSTGLGVVRDYFDALEHHGVSVTTQDSAADPELSKQVKVTKNGTVGFRCGSRTDNLTIGDEREEAERKVKHLDSDVRGKLARITKDAQNVYVTVGHGERSVDVSAHPGQRVSAKGLKKLIEALNGKPKKLGVADGLTKEVPKDAALVIVPGPTKPFLPEEAKALATYVEGGGSLLLMLDPPIKGDDDGAAATASLQPLLDTLGVKVGVHEVLNDRSYVKNTNTDADHAFLFSTSFGNHKSVKTLSSARGKAALLFLSAAAVEKVKRKGDAKGGPKVSMLARTPAASWIDENDDRKPDDKTEARAVLDLAAAVEMPKETGDKDAHEGRAIVVGDSDVLADMLVVQDANQVFGYEGLLWLLRDDDKLSAAGVKPDEDVPIRHTRDEDTAWFYLTILAGPALCLGGGLTFVRLKRRRRRPPAGAPPSSSSPSPPSSAADTAGAGQGPGAGKGGAA